MSGAGEGPSALRNFLVMAALLFGGAGAGALLVEILAPQARVANIVGFLMLPMCLGFGMSAWFSMLKAAMWSRLGGAVIRTAKGQDFEEAVRDSFSDLRNAPPPGTNVFVPVSLMICLVAGTVIGLSPGPAGFVTAVLVVAGAGLVYGLLLRDLARRGLLLMPDGA